MDQTPPIPPETLHRAAEVGREAGLKYVYPGNLGMDADTNCPACGQWFIHRNHFGVSTRVDEGGFCPYCGEVIAGVGLSDQ